MSTCRWEHDVEGKSARLVDREGFPSAGVYMNIRGSFTAWVSWSEHSITFRTLKEAIELIESRAPLHGRFIDKPAPRWEGGAP